MLEEEAEDSSSWLTKTDNEQVSEELHYLKQFDQATNEYIDIAIGKLLALCIDFVNIASFTIDVIPLISSMC
jgi:hypothetical protein